MCHSVCSCQSPWMSRYRSLVASDRLTIVPVRRMWTDGSLPARPKRMTLFTLRPINLSFLLIVPVDRIERLSPVDLDVLAIGIAVELSGHRVDVQIAPRQAVLVEHNVTGLSHE